MKYLICLAVALAMAEARTLESYNIAADTYTASGFDSGASFASQMHVSYQEIKGVAMYAGIPYHCAQGAALQETACNQGEGPDAEELVSDTLGFESNGYIDTTYRLRDTNVFALIGTIDSMTNQTNLNKTMNYYVRFMASTSIKSVDDMVLEHGWPTEDYGSPCDQINTDLYINNCGYHGAYEALNYLYGGGLVKPDSSTPTAGDFYEYDQIEFQEGESFDDFGYAYIPTACMDSSVACSLHLHFHGCGVGRSDVGDQYVLNTFITHVAELNNIITLFPQVSSSPGNAQGCWDVNGYTNPIGPANTVNYVTQRGSQPDAVIRMVERVTGVSPPPFR